ncbi:MAG: alanine--tRNA ligase [Actinobacteria bacterium]|nr:alanine--tRNA ligase [Actinomycetota bacterium]
MDSATVRDRFVAFFEERGHARVPSSSLIPRDKSLLFTNSGMIQFVPYFRGEQTPPVPRAVSVQKCMRAGGKHNDLDEVGRTTRHLTFFEMLGNFSFGDYYKEKACPWAWELVTEAWGIDPDRLWVTIFETDEEAHQIWTDAVGVDVKRIVRLGKADNYWSLGAAGPCGPCSEICVDMGDAFGPASDRGPMDNEARYPEIWNLVFIQDECNADIEPIGSLPAKSIDTGAGLERVAMVLQDAPNVFETDTLGAMVSCASELAKVRYGAGASTDVALKILADHGRALTFMLADDMLPSNEERGYVLRRIMRRAIRNARLLGREGSVLPELAGRCIELMGDAYPEIAERKDFIIDVAAREEERFSATLSQGMGLLQDEMERAGAGPQRPLAGEVAFRLHDTFGFPIDLTTEIAAEAGVGVDTDEFARLMDEQRARGRSSMKAGDTPTGPRSAGMTDVTEGPTEFVGYEHLTASARLLALLDAGASVAVLEEGGVADAVLDRTVFYAEGGGQVGDTGTIYGPAGEARVIDTRRLAPGVTGHKIRVIAGAIAPGEVLRLEVDAARRTASGRAHTATHILHWVLRDRFGDHAKQAGSLVEPGRLRFDFHHFNPVSDEELEGIGRELQQRVLADDNVRAYETSYDFARSIGAMAIFGEKYGDFVRVVEVGDYSKELCGGTHVPHTGGIAVGVLTSEGSIGANLRRVEALVGQEGIDFLARRAAVLERAARALKANPDDVAERVERLLATQKEMEGRLGDIDKRAAETEAAQLAESAVNIDGARLVVARRDVGVDQLRSFAQSLRSRIGSGIVVLGTAQDGKANLVGAVTGDLVQRGISARDLLAPGAALLGGGAGGKAELAISGGAQADALDEAMRSVAGAARDALSR